jgi:hypothetical protein
LALYMSALAVHASAEQKWLAKDYSEWSPAEMDRVLTDSPWAKQASASFGAANPDPRDTPVPLPTPQQAGLPGPRAASDGHWDGGVGRMPRGSPPTITVTVRWDSAVPVRSALFRSHDPGSHDTEHTLAQPEKDYIITVIGLVPARRPATAGSEERNQFDTTRMRAGLMNTARLLRRDKRAIAPEDVQIDEPTGAVRLFFPRTDPITADEKEVTFGTTFGAMRVVQKFRLKDMTYKGKLEL